MAWSGRLDSLDPECVLEEASVWVDSFGSTALLSWSRTDGLVFLAKPFTLGSGLLTGCLEEVAGSPSALSLSCLTPSSREPSEHTHTSVASESDPGTGMPKKCQKMQRQEHCLGRDGSLPEHDEINQLSHQLYRCVNRCLLSHSLQDRLAKHQLETFYILP